MTATHHHKHGDTVKMHGDKPPKTAPQDDTESTDLVLQATNSCFIEYQESMKKYLNEILIPKSNAYYDIKQTPRFMMNQHNDEVFRIRMERLKGLHAYTHSSTPSSTSFEAEYGVFDDETLLKNSKKHSKAKTLKKLKSKSKVKLKSSTKSKTKSTADKAGSEEKKKSSIFNPKGKSSMNYKFRAFKKSNQPNSFVQPEDLTSDDETSTNMADSINNSKHSTPTPQPHHHRHHGGGHSHTHFHHAHQHYHRSMRGGHCGNIHVNDDDIFIDHADQIDMNELINGLVYSQTYQDKRIGTLNTAMNDYSQYFVDTQKRPQNFIRELHHNDRLSEYPKLRKLMQTKNEALRKISATTPPFYINTDLRTFDLSSLQCKFDVILVDPPWPFYVDRCPASMDNLKRTPWSFEQMSTLKIHDIAENPSFLFLWCGAGKSLNEGRQLLKKWGYKRCEVIVWLKTNKKSQIRLSLDDEYKTQQVDDYLLEKHDEHNAQYLAPNDYEGNTYSGLFVRSYEHCLMGIRGQVRRSTDGHLIHANVDTDVIITESAPYGSSKKPNELYDIIERFCMGRKRIELFGCAHNLRPGWLTIGDSNGGIPKSSNYDAMYYNSLFSNTPNTNTPRYVPSTNEIEQLRPKSPIRNNSKNSNNTKHNNNATATTGT